MENLEGNEFYKLYDSAHVCPITETGEDKLSIAMNMFKVGLRRGDRLLFISNQNTYNEFRKKLSDNGIKPEELENKGTLITSFVPDNFSGDETFDANSMIRTLKLEKQQALADGFNGLMCFAVTDDWATAPKSYHDAYLQFEILLNILVKESGICAICQYSRPMHTEALIHDVIRTHSTVVLGKSVFDNPYYEPPELILHDEEKSIEEYKASRVQWWIGQLLKSKVLEQEKNLLEQKFRQAQKMETVATLAAGLAHDFNNIISIISGHSLVLLKKLNSMNVVVNNVEAIIRASDRAAALTKQLLSFGKKQIISLTPVNLNSVILEFKKLLELTIGQNIELVLNLKNDLGWVLADRSQMEQVVLNLAINAKDAMPDGGTLTITTSDVENEKSVELRVTDTGSGISPEVLARLFEPFYTTKELGKGTGLGLTVVESIIHSFKGRIHVESKLGSGTSFYIRLPRSDGAPKSKNEQSSKSANFRGTETILIVDDEPDLREMFRSLAEDKGYKVLTAASAEEALGMLRKTNENIQLLVTDVVLPKMNGGELSKEFFEIFPQSRCLFISGYPDARILSAGIDPKTINYLQKPFSGEEFIRKIREILGSEKTSQAD